MCVSVCVSVCLSVCPAEFLWTKFKPNGCTDLDAIFAKWLLIALAQTLLKLVTLDQRSRSQWRNHFFSYNSMLTSLPCISALLCLIKMKFGMSLWYTLVRFLFKFHKIRWEMTSLWHHLSYLQTIVHISNSIEPTNFVLGTNTQQHNVYLISKMKVTLTGDEGHRRRSKVKVTVT